MKIKVTLSVVKSDLSFLREGGEPRWTTQMTFPCIPHAEYEAKDKGIIRHNVTPMRKTEAEAKADMAEYAKKFGSEE